jgi:MerR family transcriptional regulator, light-induced transcriptional regulator
MFVGVIYLENTNQEIYKFILNRKEQLAEKILYRKLVYQPELKLNYTDENYKKYLIDISYHLTYLAEAITLNNLEVFKDYILWAKSVVQDIEINLKCIKDILYSQLSKEMNTIVNCFIDTAITNLALPIICSKVILGNNNAYLDILSEYLDLILKTQRIKASKLIMDEIEKGTSIKNIYVYVFEPSLKEVGRLWQINKITVAQEHYFTATTQLIMSQLYSRIFSSKKNGLKFIGACASEEIHEVGLRMVTDILELDGWDTYYLGANLPKKDLMSFLIDQKPDIFGISVTMTFYLHKVIELIDEVRDTQELKNIKILVGGYPFNADKNLWKQVGADLYAPNAIETSDLLMSTFKGGISYER